MIERRQLSQPGWRIETPEWVRRLQKVTLPLPRPVDDVTRAERTAMRAATTRRASEIRVEAERDYFGLLDR